MKVTSGVEQITDKNGCVRVKFTRPVLRITKNEAMAQCMVPVEGYAAAKYNPLLMDLVAQNPDNFYRPGQEYNIPLKQAQMFVGTGIPVRHINNSRARTANEMVFQTDVRDPRVENEYKVAEIVGTGDGKSNDGHKVPEVKGESKGAVPVKKKVSRPTKVLKDSPESVEGGKEITKDTPIGAPGLPSRITVA